MQKKEIVSTYRSVSALALCGVYVRFHSLTGNGFSELGAMVMRCECALDDVNVENKVDVPVMPAPRQNEQ